MARTYSIAQAAARLGVGYRHTRRLIASGQIKAVELAEGESTDGRQRWGITPQALAAYLRRRRAT